MNFKILAIVSLSAFSFCVADTTPDGNPLDAFTGPGILLNSLINAEVIRQRQAANPTTTGTTGGGTTGTTGTTGGTTQTTTQQTNTQLTATVFTHGQQIMNLVQVGSTIYFLVNTSQTSTPNFRIFSSTDGVTLSPIGVNFGSGFLSTSARLQVLNSHFYVFEPSSTSNWFRSTDLGANWNSLNTVLPGSDSITCFFGDNVSTIYRINDTNLYSSNDQGANFVLVSTHSGLIPRTNAAGCVRFSGTNYIFGGSRSSNSAQIYDLNSSTSNPPSTWTQIVSSVSGTNCSSFYSTLGVTSSGFILENSSSVAFSANGSTWTCRSFLTGTGGSNIFISSSQGMGNARLGNRVFIYGSSNSTSFDKGVYLDLP